MLRQYKVVSVCASLTPYVEMPGQVITMDKAVAAQFAGYLIEVRAPEAPPAKKMVVEAPAKKDVDHGRPARTARKDQAVPRG